MRLPVVGNDLSSVNRYESVGFAIGYAALALASAIQIGGQAPGLLFASIILAFGAATFAFPCNVRRPLFVIPATFVAVLTWAIQFGPVDCWPTCGTSQAVADAAGVTLLALMVGVTVLGVAVAARRSPSRSA